MSVHRSFRNRLIGREKADCHATRKNRNAQIFYLIARYASTVVFFMHGKNQQQDSQFLLSYLQARYRVVVNISSETVPSATFATDPLMVTEKSFPMEISIWPPGM